MPKLSEFRRPAGKGGMCGTLMVEGRPVYLQAFQVGAIKTLAKASVSSLLREGREGQQVPVSL